MKRNRKLWMMAVWAIAGLLALGLQPVEAAQITFDLNYVIDYNGSGPGPATSSWGTVILADSGNNVLIDVNLTGSGVLKVQKVLLNFDDSLFSNANNFGTAIHTNIGIIENKNSAQADGYTLGYFDLKIPDPPPGNLGFEPWGDAITLAGSNLDTSNFDFLSTDGFFQAAVHIGNLTNGQSIWVGAHPGGTSVPEPGTMALLGSGLIGLAGWCRKKVKK